MNRRFFLLIASLMMLAGQASSREVIFLNNGWQFGKSLTKSGQSVKVDLPHSWDVSEGAFSGDSDYHYFREIYVPAQWESKEVFLRFNGVSSVATVFVNGKFVGRHEGAFTAFTFNISHYLRYGTKNTILVYVSNNTQMDMMPLLGPAKRYGGIYRDVELIVTEKQHISVTHYSSDGVYITQKDVSEKKAELNVDVMLSGNFGDRLNGKLDIYHYDRIVESVTAEATIGANGAGMMTFPVVIESPRLWNGKKDPFMYTAEVTVYDSSGKEKDKVTESFGLRSFHIDRQKGFFLNGESYPLTGVLLNQERSDTGIALSRGQLEEDINAVRDIGATAVRFAGAPHDKYQYELCDRNGIIVWSDLPFFGDEVDGGLAFVNSYDFKNNGVNQLKEMIWQNYNHPSVIFWGLFGNLAGGGDNPAEYVQELNRVAKIASPNRITVASSNQDGEINSITDAISWSQYFGWRKGLISDLNIWLNGFKNGWPNIKPAIGEYGAGGRINVFSGRENVRELSELHPESAQTEYHMQYLNAITGRPYLWGYFVNSLFDTVNGDMGLATSNRDVKKDAYYLYRANWNENDKMLHLAGKRDIYRTGGKQTVIAFTNTGSAELTVNDKVISTVKAKNGVVRWENVPMKAGENKIEVRSGSLTDGMTVYISKQL